MTNLAPTQTIPSTVPVVAPVAGLAVYVVTLAVTQAGYDSRDWVITLAAGAVLTLIAGVLGVRAAHLLDARRIGRTSLVLAVIGAATFPVFWVGAIQIFGLTAAVLGLLARSAAGRWHGFAAIALALGTLDVIAGVYLLVTG